MRYLRRLEEDERLRLLRMKQVKSSSEEKNKLEQKSADAHSVQAAHLQHQQAHIQQDPAFKSLNRADLEWITAWYEQFLRYQKLDLWKKFVALTVGQKRAVLLDMSQIQQSSLFTEDQPDWGEWNKRISLVQAIPLEDEEGFREKRTDEATRNENFYMIKQSELLSPYREILLWLCYKGNHQSQQALLQKIDQLDSAAKKLLILKLSGNQKCNSLTFSQQVTITKYQQTTVDWERISTQLLNIDALEPEQIEKELEKYEANEASASQERSTKGMVDRRSASNEYDEMEEDELEELDYELEEQNEEKQSSLLDEYSEMQAEEKLEQAFGSKAGLAAALLTTFDSGSLLSILTELVKRKGQNKLQRLDFIDICLRIPLDWSAAKRMKSRNKEMQKLGIESVQQLFEQLLHSIAKSVYKFAIEQQDTRYIEILKKFMNTELKTTAEELEKQIHLQIE